MLDPDQRELLAERIAIMVVDGGLTPVEAERRARETITPRTPPESGGGACPAGRGGEQMTLIEPDYKHPLREFYKKH